MRPSLTFILLICLAQLDIQSSSVKAVFVHLFEWSWADVATECEQFLAPNGFSGVQVSPAQESLDLYAADAGVDQPWWQRWQPVSYELDSLSGNAAGFQDMVERCTTAGLRVFADMVFNQMTGTWPGIYTSTGNSAFNTETQDYPAVPYNSSDFNDDICNSESGNVVDFTDAEEIRNCKFYSLHDLDQSRENVRTAIVDYMNGLIEMGVGGFRVDSAKHMWPQDLEVIYNRLNDLNEAFYPPGSRPIIFQEVRDLGGEAVTADEYFHLGLVTEFRYPNGIGEAFKNINGQSIYILRYLNELRGFMPSQYALVFVDHYENQRGHGPGGLQVLRFTDDPLYSMANSFTMAWDYGTPRTMSSYNFTHPDAGAPSDPVCTGAWICEHRWTQTVGMIGFRNAAEGTIVSNWWDNGADQIAFSREGAGFIAINNEDITMSEILQTSLSAGTYCDVITGSLNAGTCTGVSFEVVADGTATINLEPRSHMAIHTGSKIP